MKRSANRQPLRDRVRRMFGKRFRAGSYSAFAAVIVIAIAVVVNMIFGALPASITQLDLTEQSLYSLSDQTRRIVASLDKDVDLYLLATTGNEDDTISLLLDRYSSLSDHISVSYVDPTSQPTFLDGYDLTTSQLYANSVIVDCGGRFRLVGYDEIYVTSYVSDSSSYYGYSTTTEFAGENALTNAIHYVSSDDLPKLYALTGHGETELDSSITDMIAQDNMELESLSLLSLEAVPEDATALVINAPQNDLGEDESAMLIEWMLGGGRIVLITDYIDSGEMPNLMSVTEIMGMTIGDGLIIEGDSSMHIGRYPYYLLPDVASHEITDAIIDGGYYILTPLAQGIETVEGASASVTNLLSTSASAYTKADGMNAATTEKEEGDAEGTFYPAAASELGEGRMVWFASSSMLDSYIDQAVSGANSDLFLNALNWMVGQEESISIRTKSLDRSTLTVTSAQNSFWSIVMIGLIPLCFIALGATVTIRRKRR